MKTITFMLLTVFFSLISLVAQAGKIYRFLDKDGVSTLSKELPPYAAQKGYDILDDKSLRLIERVYTREELIQIQKQQQVAAQKEQEKLKRQQEARRKLLKQRVNDRNLLARYPTEEIFIKSRDEDLQYHEKQVEELKTILASNKKKLTQLQEQAAEIELNGEAIGKDLQKKISETENEIKRSKQMIQQVTEENKKLAKQYQKEHARLRELLSMLKKNKSKYHSNNSH